MKPAAGAGFVGEAEAYALLQRTGFQPPRHALVGDPLPFAPGEPVVLKGLGENLWHKSELGAVKFMPFDSPAVLAAAQAMRGRVEAAGHRWIGGLVCERVAVARADVGEHAQGEARDGRHPVSVRFIKRRPSAGRASRFGAAGCRKGGPPIGASLTNTGAA